jgi:hypothetical protein
MLLSNDPHQADIRSASRVLHVSPITLFLMFRHNNGLKFSFLLLQLKYIISAKISVLVFKFPSVEVL